MGASFTNCQVRSDDANAVAAALAPLLQTRAYVSPVSGGWVTVYDETTESQDSKILIRLAKELSKALNTTVFGFLVHDSDIAVYYLCQNGVLVDEFNSSPDYFDEAVSDKERLRVHGVTEKLLPLCVKGTIGGQIDAVIHPESAEDFPVFAEEIVRDLGTLLGMDEDIVGLGFEYFESEGEGILDNAADFILVKKGATPPKVSAPAKAAAPTPRALEPKMTKADALKDLKLDMLAMAVAMLARDWTDLARQQAAELAKILPPEQVQGMQQQIAASLEKNVRGFIKASKLANKPTYEELAAARDAGPDALAALLAQRTPDILGVVASQAIADRMEKFLAALLKHGLDPQVADHHGYKILDAAEKLGADSPIYRMLKEAAGKKE